MGQTPRSAAGPQAGVQSRPGDFTTLKPPVVRCGAGALDLIEVQLEGRRRMSGADLVNGQRLTESDYLGERTN